MADLVVKLFNKYDSKYEFASGGNGPRQIWTTNSYTKYDEKLGKLNKVESKNENLDLKYKAELTITNDEKMIKQLYKKLGVIQLRKLEKETKLIVGCGNGPVFHGMKPVSANIKTVKLDENWIEYHEKHLHDGCFTIDPDVGMNPSIVAQFGVQDLNICLPENQFTEVIFEDFMLNLWKRSDTEWGTKNRLTIDNLLWIMTENGTVGNFKKMNGKLVHKSGFVINDDSPDSFYKFAKGY